MKKFQKFLICAFVFLMASFAFADDWYVCVGSYSSVDNASELVYSLQKKGIDTFVYEFTKDNGSKLYRVLVDEAFTSRDKARIRRDALENDKVIKSLRISGLWICQAAAPIVEAEPVVEDVPEVQTVQPAEAPVVEEEQPAVRFVLEWEDKSLDLDTAFTTSKYFVDYDNPVVAGIRLYYDSELDYAPETLTVQAIDPMEEYNYYVVDYENYEDSNSSALSISGARVLIYVNGELQATLNVTPGSKGSVWHVFDIINSEIIPVDNVGFEDLYE